MSTFNTCCFTYNSKSSQVSFSFPIGKSAKDLAQMALNIFESSTSSIVYSPPERLEIEQLREKIRNHDPASLVATVKFYTYWEDLSSRIQIPSSSIPTSSTNLFINLIGRVG
ncbi:MAG: hypothetical protein MRY21_03445 [Simkaniaceae bacterium]|nr:hypothetical protein [Simkaniaceae bacterium]